MKKTIPISSKARSATGWHRHLDKKDQRRANKGTRQVFKREDTDSLSPGMMSSVWAAKERDYES